MKLPRWTMTSLELPFPDSEERSSSQLCQLYGDTARLEPFEMLFAVSNSLLWAVNVKPSKCRWHWLTSTAITLRGTPRPPETSGDLKLENLLWSDPASNSRVNRSNIAFADCHKWNIGQISWVMSPSPNICAFCLASIVWRTRWQFWKCGRHFCLSV